MKILIVGAGYLGAELGARLVTAGHEVTGWVRSPESAAKLVPLGMRAVAADMHDHKEWLRHAGDWEVVVFCPSTRGGEVADYRRIYADGIRRVYEEASYSRRVIHVSSTSVYGQNDGEEVDENSPACPLAETGDVLLEAEEEVLRRRGTVLRLGGIYGSGRGMLLKRFRAGDFSIPGGRPDRWLNQIHRDDACQAIIHLLENDVGDGEIYNVVDNEPATYQEIFQWMAEATGTTFQPQGAGPLSRRGSSNKRILNKKLRSTGWEPGYPTFREGYLPLLDAGSSA